MNNQDIKFTVIIPTRERADTLQWALKTCIAQDYQNLEILISDNFSQDNTREVVDAHQDSRIKYINTGKRVSMSSNWEFALSHISEGWVTILGDDDALLPNALQKVLAIIQKTDVQVIRSNQCTYYWPSFRKKETGSLVVPLAVGYEVRDSKKWLSKLMSGHVGYPELPVIYNGGFVSFEILEKIKSVTGLFYNSCIPDIYSCIAIASFTDKYVYSREPFAISGVSIHSTGASQFSGNKSDVKSPKNKFISEGNIPFHPDVPICADGNYPSSIHAMVYESYLQSSFLRHSVNTDNIHAQQLEIILATSENKFVYDVEMWGKSFAEIHELNFDLISMKANMRRLFFTISWMKFKFSSMVNTHLVESKKYPIQNIYEASVMANSTIQCTPSTLSRLTNLSSVLKRSIDSIRNKFF